MEEAMKKYGLEFVKEKFKWNSYCYDKSKILNTNNYCAIFTAMQNKAMSVSKIVTFPSAWIL